MMGAAMFDRQRILACIVLLLLWAPGCERRSAQNEVIVESPVFVSPEKVIGPEIFQQIDPDIRLGDALRQDTPTSPDVPDIPPQLAADGRIPSKGVISQLTGCTDVCSCQTVTLVRVETRDFTGTVGSFVFGTLRARFAVTRVFDLNNPALPPQAGALRFPARDPGDLVCFYFSFPPCLAFYVARGRPHPCRTLVEVSYPSFNPGQQNFKNVYQLYSVRGFADFATGTENVICVQPGPNRTIPAGNGSVAWEVLGTVCQRINFTVF